jgi:hypothetical protein
VLQNNAAGDLPLNANGSFAFAPQLDGTGYAITVKTQPTSRSQTCTVTNGSGTVGGANVTNVAVTCSLSGECNVVNGIRWCRDTADARSCNTFCSSIGLGNPTISDAAWLAAQDTSAECQQIASAFGLGGGISLSDYTYACTEQVFTMLFCSTLAGCPTNHRTTSSGVGHRAICPCQ